MNGPMTPTLMAVSVRPVVSPAPAGPAAINATEAIAAGTNLWILMFPLPLLTG